MQGECSPMPSFMDWGREAAMSRYFSPMVWCTDYTWKQCSNIFCWLSRKKFEHERKFWLVEMVNGPSSSLLPFHTGLWTAALLDNMLKREAWVLKIFPTSSFEKNFCKGYYKLTSDCALFLFLQSLHLISLDFEQTMYFNNLFKNYKTKKMRGNDKLCGTFCGSRSFCIQKRQ